MFAARFDEKFALLIVVRVSVRPFVNTIKSISVFYLFEIFLKFINLVNV